jgi:uncharacterized protein YheU (UPF0270 family)
MSDSDPYDGGAPEPPVPVPYREISAPALRSLVESFVLREGTDYGEHEVSLDEKVWQVMRQLERGEAEVMFDPNTNSVSVVLASGRRPRD